MKLIHKEPCHSCGGETRGFWTEQVGFAFLAFHECQHPITPCGSQAVVSSPQELQIQSDEIEFVQSIPLASGDDLRCPQCGSALYLDDPIWTDIHQFVPLGWVAACTNGDCTYSETPFNSWNLRILIGREITCPVFFCSYDAEALHDEGPDFEAWLDGKGPSLADREKRSTSDPNTKEARLFRREVEARAELHRSLDQIISILESKRLVARKDIGSSGR